MVQFALYHYNPNAHPLSQLSIMSLPDYLVKAIKSQFLSTGDHDRLSFGEIAIESSSSPIKNKSAAKKPAVKKTAKKPATKKGVKKGAKKPAAKKVQGDKEEEKDGDDGRVSPSNPPQVLARPPKRIFPTTPKENGVTRWTLPS